MQITLASLNKKAVEAALTSNWDEAIQLNLQILDCDPSNEDAKVRLGRAYIQTRNFSKAQKIFREILKRNPINTVARKNLELANKRKTDSKTHTTSNSGSLLIEPGKCKDCTALVTAKGVTSNEFTPGEHLFLRIKKKFIEVIKIRKGTKVPVAIIESKEIIQKAAEAINAGGLISATYVRGKEKEITVLIKSTVSVFRSEKQEIKPYLKKGSIDEPEVENEEVEEQVVEE